MRMHDFVVRPARGHGGRLAGRRQERSAKVADVKRRLAVVLLDLVLPGSGKKLRDATFAECAKVGGWYAKVAKMGGPRQIVGRVLSEEKLQAVK
jgi:hypothetical protein